MRWITAIGGGLVILGALWTAGEFTGARPTLLFEHEALAGQVKDNTDGLLIIKYDLLERRVATGNAPTPDKVKFCQIAAKLKIPTKHCK